MSPEVEIIQSGIIGIFWLTLLLGVFLGFVIYQPVCTGFYLFYRFVRRCFFRAKVR